MKLTSTLTDTAMMKEIGTRLRRVRIDRALTQVDLAAATGLSRLTIVGIESGRSVQMVSLIRVLRGLGLIDSLEHLLPGNEMGPVERRDTGGKGRQRVRKKAVLEVAKDWKWGDEE